jgi:mono/diheme cytochrome c family protein
MSARPATWQAVPTAAGGLLGLVVAGLWLLSPATADASAGGDAETGRELFATHCAACHGPDGRGSGNVPPLVGVTERLGPEVAARTIRDGRDRMPAFGDRLDEAQISDLLAHIEQLPATGSAQQEGSRMPMRHGQWRDMMGDWPASFALVWLAVGLAVLVLVVIAVVWLARRASTSGSGPGREAAASASRALDILDQRYARGEITREEYLQVRRDLQGPG